MRWPRINRELLRRGAAKWTLGGILLLAGIGGGATLQMQGCQDVQDAVEWTDPTGEPVNSEDGEPLELQ